MDIFVQHPERIAVIGVILVAAELLLARGWRRSTRIVDHGLALAGVVWLLYAVWELLIVLQSPEANIRVDLLLIVPIVVIVTVIGVALEIRRCLRAATT